MADITLRGLLGTEAYASQRFTSIRRRVFHQYPAGAAPLIGTLSMINTDKPLNDPEFTIFERRYIERKAATTAFAAGSNGPFGNAAGNAALATNADQTLTPGTFYTLQVNDTSLFRVDNTARLRGVRNNAGTLYNDFVVIITAVSSATLLQFTPLNVQTSYVGNATGVNIGLELRVIGSSYRQGARGSTQTGLQLPVSVSNAAQIWRASFAFTGTELKTGGLKFDESGIYGERARAAALENMEDIEMSLLFGEYSKDVDEEGLPRYTTRGIESYLKLWEAGGTYNNEAATLNSDENKRIINVFGNLSYRGLLNYYERVFRVTSNVANEKLVLCGNGWLSSLDQIYEGKHFKTVNLPNMPSEFGQDVTVHKTQFGTMYYKTHPLFNLNPHLRYDAMILDVPNILYRPVQDRDTRRLINRQANDFDGRKDEYLTEAGFEIRFPESHMWMRGVMGAARG